MQLTLPITPHDFVGQILEPALDLLPTKMGAIEARIMLLAIALQESGLAYRQQVGGPARGLLQFEQGGGVKGVLTHPASRNYAADVCLACKVVAAPIQVYEALDQDDVLAVALGRLLLWTDPRTLPQPRDALGAWNLYQRVWRPGRPRPDHWAGHYQTACAALGIA
jgi:hypothetical protein